MLAVDDTLVEYARHLACDYDKRLGSLCTEETLPSSEALDSILYDMVHALL